MHERIDRQPALDVAAAWLRDAGRLARRAWATQRERQHAARTRRALRDLDDRALRDLGFARDEIDSVAAEAAGQTECTRIRVALAIYGQQG